jgi:hypothetical protein
VKDSRPRPLFRLLIVLIVVALALALWLVQDSKVNSLRPEKTKRAIAARSVPKPRPLAEDPPTAPIHVDDEDITSVILWIYPRADGSWRYPGSTGYQVGPADYWPMDDEAPWPDIDSADALQVLAETLRTGEGSAGEAAGRFLLHAQDDGLLDHADQPTFDSPWTGLVAMQAKYVDTIWQTGLWPKDGTVDFTKNVDIAQFIIDTWPDDPAAEYARLHLLQLSNHTSSIQHNADETVDWIVDIIEHTQDALVLDVAIGEFTTIEKSTFDAHTIAAISSVFDETELNTQRGIIRAMLNHHTHTENWAQVDVWTNQLVAHEEQVQWDKDSTTSLNTQSVLSDLAGYRSVREGHQPSNWREEVSTVVHMCHEDHPIDRSIGGEAEWADGWRWNAWWDIVGQLSGTAEPADAPNFIDCVRLTDWQHEPPQTTLLTVKVMR